jgi:D-serine dehydratase
VSWTVDGLRHKGIPLGVTMDSMAVGAAGWVVSRGDTATPVATLSLEDLRHNASSMADFCQLHGVSLAPHAKTTLSPELLQIQLEHGAWAMTAALPRQVALLWEQGIDRVLVANEVTDPAAVQWLSAKLDAEPERELWLYADSTDAVDRLTAAVRERAGRRPLDVLVEVGHAGGRTGCRGAGAAELVARAVVASPALRLAGVAAYEGTIGARREPGPTQTVDAFLGEVGELVESLAGQAMFEVAEPVLTAGGSVWFDRVVDVLGLAARAVNGRLVLRSGCYLIHDHGMYAAGTPAAANVSGAPAFRAALSVWARVLSRPEPGLLLADAGRRDLSHDAGLPVAISAHRPADRHVGSADVGSADVGAEGVGGVDLVTAGAIVSGLSDQHTFVQVPDTLDVRVGDLVRLGISHPCTTLDRWPVLLLVDNDHAVVGAVHTQF